MAESELLSDSVLAQNTAARNTPSRMTMPIELQQLLQHASQLQQQNQLQEAQQKLHQILQHYPDNPAALHLLGVVTFQSGDTKQAIRLIEKALQNNDQVAVFHSNIGEMYRIQKQLDKAIVHGKLAIDLEPDSASAHSNLGIAYFDQDNMILAEKCQLNALQLSPNLVTALNNMGSICKKRKDSEQAIHYYQKAIKIDTNNPEPLNNLAAVLITEERSEEAEKHLCKALRLVAEYPDAHCNLGFALHKQHKEDEALKAFKLALHYRPEYSEAYLGLAMVYRDKKNYEQAKTNALRSIELDPEKPEYYSELGSILTITQNIDGALQAFDHALSLDPNHNGTQLGKGNLLMEIGQMKEAEHCFNSCLNGPLKDQLPARFYLTQLRTVNKADTNFAQLLKAVQQPEILRRAHNHYQYFALGKSFSDTQDYHRSMEHYNIGCAIKRKQIQYSADEMDNLFKQVIKIMDQDRIKQLSRFSNPSCKPIFILGMPRSGTTLTEQIISSHPKVYGAGEIPDFLDIINSPFEGAEELTYPKNISRATEGTFRFWTDEYLRRLEQHDIAAPFITDKMPSNFFCFGFDSCIIP